MSIHVYFGVCFHIMANVWADVAASALFILLHGLLFIMPH